MNATRQLLFLSLTATLCAVAPQLAMAQAKYDAGASDSEIVIGSTQPLSGPASSYAALGTTMAAYFRMVNDQGGINGRKVRFILYDDAYAPPKTVEMTRKLVESDQVLLTTGSLGTATQLAVAGYMNQRKVPQLFVSAPASKLANPKTFPWTINFSPLYEVEGAIYATHLLATKPAAKVAMLMQDDEAGKALASGFLSHLARKNLKPVSTQTYQSTDPGVDSQIIQMKESGADTVFLLTMPRMTAMALRKIASLGWKPTIYVSQAGASIKGALEPAGPGNAIGVISSTYRKRLGDPAWNDDPDMKAWLAFKARYMPGTDPYDEISANGYDVANATRQVLQMAGNDLTHAHVMRIVANLKNFRVPLVLPGMTFNVTPDDYAGFKQLQMGRFDGKSFQPLGDLVSAQ